MARKIEEEKSLYFVGKSNKKNNNIIIYIL